MDVTRTIVLLLFSTLLLHCAQKENYGFVEANSICQAQATPNQFVVHWRSGGFDVVTAASKESFIENFLAKHQDQVDWAEHDFTIKAPTATADSDPFPSDWGTERIEAPKMWAQGIWGQGIVVAVVDTGVDIEHVKLAPNIYRNQQETRDDQDNDGNGYVDDLHGYNFADKSGEMLDDKGHGTHVAGIIAATHDQGFTKGVAPQSKILPLRTINASGFGSSSDAALAIQYAVSRGAKVINASWGGPNCSVTLYSAIQELEGQDVLFVAAAGNDTGSIDRYSIYPAAFPFPHQITVGASGATDLMANFSNYSRTKVHLLAPGILWGTMPGNYESVQRGTSMAAPMVSGAAALLKSALPQVSMVDVRQALMDGVDAPPIIAGESTPYPVASGGRLNVWNSFQLLQNRPH